MAYDIATVPVYGHNPSVGAQSPEKYPFVGDWYRRYGEQPGYIYDPYSDKYLRDPKVANAYYESVGLQEPEKKPDNSLLGQVGPLAAAAGAVGLGQALGKDPGNFLGGLKNSIGGLFGLGESTPATASPVASAASATAPVTNGGTFGLGSLFGGGGSAAASELALPGAEIGSTSFGGMSLPTIGLEAAPEVSGQGIFGLSGAASPMLGAAGLAAGAYTGYQSLKGIKNALKGKDLSFQEQAALALPTFGLSFGYNKLKDLFGGDGDKWKTESNKLSGLKKDGTYIPDNLLAGMPTKGRSYDELVNKNYGGDFIGRDSSGNWVNNKFATSRNVNDLRGEDIVNYATFAENDSNWFNKPLEERLAIANDALKAGAVSEGKGSVNVDWKKFNATPKSQPTDLKPPPKKDPGRKGK